MANNDVTVVTGTNASVAAAAASLDTALSAIDTADTVFLCEIYRQGQNWYHLLIHKTQIEWKQDIANIVGTS